MKNNEQNTTHWIEKHHIIHNVAVLLCINSARNAGKRVWLSQPSSYTNYIVLRHKTNAAFKCIESCLYACFNAYRLLMLCVLVCNHRKVVSIHCHCQLPNNCTNNILLTPCGKRSYLSNTYSYITAISDKTPVLY